MYMWVLTIGGNVLTTSVVWLDATHHLKNINFNVFLSRLTKGERFIAIAVITDRALMITIMPACCRDQGCGHPAGSAGMRCPGDVTSLALFWHRLICHPT
eukprot:750796-Amorphochlora_amoeboformis.AAC.2